MSLDPVILVETIADAESQTPPAKPGSVVDILARTLWGEARGEPVRGIEAVAAIIINRVKRADQHGGRYWWGASIGQVCQKPWQFSCWNENDPNRAKLQAVTEKDRVFRICLRVARRAVAGGLDDPTWGSTHYHTKTITPPWARSRNPVAEIGNHLFYNDVE